MFFKTNEDPERGWIWNGYPIKTIGGTEVEINVKKYNITPGIRKVLVDSSYKTAKSRNGMDKVVFRYMLRKTIYYDRIPSKGRTSVRDNYIKSDLDNDVRRIFNLDTELSGKGTKFIIPSNVIDSYTRLEILHGLKLLGRTDTLTEARFLIDEIYKRGEIQNEQQYRNAPNKIKR